MNLRKHIIFNILACLTLIFICGVGVSFAWDTKEQTESDPTQNKRVGALAMIEPASRIITLGPPNVIEGAKVKELYAKEGEQVKKGQVLGVFSTYSKNQASFDVAEANLETAEANLVKVKAGAKTSDIDAQIETVNALKAQEIAAQREFKRIEHLIDKDLAAKSQYDRAKSEQGRLSAQRKAAEKTLESLKNVRPDDIAIAEAEVKKAKAQVELARADVELSMIVSPLDGTILTIYARDGEAVQNNAILDIANLETIDAVAEVDEQDILRVNIGQSAEIYIDGFETPIKGKVREIGGQIKRNAILDTDTRSIMDTRIVDVRIQLANEQNDKLRRLINRKVRATILP